MMKKSIFLLAMAAMIVSGCSDRPKDILPEDKMLDVMTDLQIAEAYIQSGDAPVEMQGANRDKIGLAVLKRHGVTEEEMDSTLAWYGRNMDEYAKLYKKIDERLAKRQQKYAKAAGESERDSQGMDLWPYGRHLAVSDLSSTDGIIISLPAEDIAPGDKITWKMRAQGASSREMTLGVEYADGSSAIVKNSSFSGDPWVQTAVQTDTLLTPTRIFGTVRFESSYPVVFLDSIQLSHQPRNDNEFDRSGFQRRVGPMARKIILPPDTSSNSSLVEDSIKARPSASISKSLGLRTRR